MLKQGKENIVINFLNQNVHSPYSSQSQNDLISLGQKKIMDPKVLFTSSWTIAAAGIYSEQGSQIWIVKDMTDLGTVLRLCGTTGVIDLILLKNGSDPSEAENYIRKRFLLSGRNFIYQETLWY